MTLLPGLFGRAVWTVCLDGLFGRAVWTGCLDGLFGRAVWTVCFAGWHSDLFADHGVCSQSGLLVSSPAFCRLSLPALCAGSRLVLDLGEMETRGRRGCYGGEGVVVGLFPPAICHF